MSLLLSLLLLAAGDPPDNALTLPPRQIQALVSTYADCVVKNEEQAASRAILSGAGDADLLRQYPQLVQEFCVPRQLGDYVQVHFTPAQMRAVIAGALVRRELAKVPPPVLDDVPALTHPAAVESDKAKADAYLSRYGECVVRVDPAAAKTLLLTDAFTDAEAAAFNAMGNALGTCIAPGRSLNFDKASLRGSIAVNYYRLAIAARSLPQAEAAR
jgi:hypothetical protein